MKTVRQTLIEKLPGDVQALVVRRAESMMRQFEYLKDKGERSTVTVLKLGWNEKSVDVICWLNSFFQIVLTPLAASARPTANGLGDAVPIRFGEKLTFEQARQAKMRSMENDFMTICHDMGVTYSMLAAHKMNDLMYSIAVKSEKR